MVSTVSKCCCCFNLKFGFLTFGTICLTFRFATCVVLYFSPSLLDASMNDKITAKVYMSIISVIGFTLGWMLATIVALFFALKGIIQERSILLFPFMVLLVIEIIVMLIYNVILTLYATPYYFIVVVGASTINIYTYMCLHNLYRALKKEEIKKRMVVDMPPSFNEI